MRHSETGRTAAYHVGTRRWQAFFLSNAVLTDTTKLPLSIWQQTVLASVTDLRQHLCSTAVINWQYLAICCCWAEFSWVAGAMTLNSLLRHLRHRTDTNAIISTDALVHVENYGIISQLMCYLTRYLTYTNDKIRFCQPIISMDKNVSCDMEVGQIFLSAYFIVQNRTCSISNEKTGQYFLNAELWLVNRQMESMARCTDKYSFYLFIYFFVSYSRIFTLVQ